jgi:hypothetical protein
MRSEMRAISGAMAGLVIVTLLNACSGDDEETKFQTGTANKQAATVTTQSTIGAVQTLVKPSSGGQSAGQASANLLASAAQAAQNAVQPAVLAATSGLTIAGVDPIMVLEPQDNSSAAGVCTCTDTSCTFQGCTIGQVTMDGTYSWGGGHVEARGLKYTIKALTPGLTADIVINVDCNLTATPTSLDGSLRSTGQTSTGVGGASYTSDWDTTLTFNDVTFPESGGRATGGSVHVDGKVTVGIAGNVQPYAAAYDITFASN